MVLANTPWSLTYSMDAWMCMDVCVYIYICVYIDIHIHIRIHIHAFRAFSRDV